MVGGAGARCADERQNQCREQWRLYEAPLNVASPREEQDEEDHQHEREHPCEDAPQEPEVAPTKSDEPRLAPMPPAVFAEQNMRSHLAPRGLMRTY